MPTTIEIKKNFFRQRRDELGLTQRQIAESFDPHLTPATVSAWEMGVASPEVARAAEVARIYKTSLAKIFDVIHKSATSRRAEKAAAN